MSAITPLQALEVLLAECELTLDHRPSFRAAMSNAHTAIIAARDSIAAPSLNAIETSEDDCELSFRDLFGEPDPSAFNPQVLAIARSLGQANEVVHG